MRSDGTGVRRVHATTLRLLAVLWSLWLWLVRAAGRDGRGLCAFRGRVRPRDDHGTNSLRRDYRQRRDPDGFGSALPRRQPRANPSQVTRDATGDFGPGEIVARGDCREPDQLRSLCDAPATNKRACAGERRPVQPLARVMRGSVSAGGGCSCLPIVSRSRCRSCSGRCSSGPGPRSADPSRRACPGVLPDLRSRR